MRSESVYRFLFVVYCVEAGLFLVVSPWTEAWERVALLLPLPILRALAAAPWMRGLLSGFGLMHLVWAAHDIDLVLRKGPNDFADTDPLGRE